jgi:hypothetical protein
MSNRRLLVAEILYRWHQLTAADLDTTEPDRFYLTELLFQRYGFCRERAQREVDLLFDEFEERLRQAAA